MVQKTVFITYLRYGDRFRKVWVTGSNPVGVVSHSDLWHKLARPRMLRRSIPFVGPVPEFDRSLQRSFRAWAKPNVRASGASGAGDIGRPERCNKEW
jgi:hypothetical protein